jgi:peptide/nickel transport system permease protein
MWRWPISRTDPVGPRAGDVRLSWIEVPAGAVLWRRLRADRAWIVGAAGVVVLVAVAALAPLIVDLIGVPRPSVRNAGTVNSLGIPTGPSAAHPFGVDRVGRDLLAEVIYGLRSSLEAGLLGTLIALVLGAGIGVAAGASARPIGEGLMRVVDAFLALPAVLLGIGLAGACGAS